MSLIKKTFWICMGILVFGTFLALATSQSLRWAVADYVGMDYENRIKDNLISSENDYGKISSEYYKVASKFDSVSFEVDITNHLDLKDSYIAFAVNSKNKEYIKNIKVSVWESWIHPKRVFEECNQTELCYHWENINYFDYKSNENVFKTAYNNIDFYVLPTLFDQDELKKVRINLEIERFSQGEFDIYYFPAKDIQNSLLTNNFVFVDPLFDSACSDETTYYDCTGTIDDSYFDAGSKAIYLHDATVNAYGNTGADGSTPEAGGYGNITLLSTSNITIRDTYIKAYGGNGGRDTDTSGTGAVGGNSSLYFSASDIYLFDNTTIDTHGGTGGKGYNSNCLCDGVFTVTGGQGGDVSFNMIATNEIEISDNTIINSYSGQGGAPCSGSGSCNLAGDHHQHTGGDAGDINSMKIQATTLTVGDDVEFDFKALNGAGGLQAGTKVDCHGGDAGDVVNALIDVDVITMGRNTRLWFYNQNGGYHGSCSAVKTDGSGGQGNLSIEFSNFTIDQDSQIYTYGGDILSTLGSPTRGKGYFYLVGDYQAEFKDNTTLFTGQNIEEDSYAKLYLGYELVLHEVLFNGTAKTNGNHIINLTGSTEETRRLGLFNTSIPAQYDVWGNASSTENITFGFNGREDWNITWHIKQANHTYNEFFGIYPPTVNLQAPTDYFNTTSPDVSFTYNTTDINNDDIANCSLFLLKSGSWETNSTDSNVEVIINQTFNITLEDTNILWKVGCYDNRSEQGNSSSYNLTVDTTDPTVNNASNITNIITMNLPTPSTWNFTSSDNGSGLKRCWYHTSDSATNVTVTCNTAQITNNWVSEGDKYIKYCANDTVGHEVCRTNSLTVFYYIYTQSVDKSSIGEGDDATFKLVINMTDLEDNYEDTYAYLNYNNSQYTPSSIHNEENYTFSYRLVIPQNAGSPTGQTVNWNWSYAITDGVSPLVNTTTTQQTQTVYSMNIDGCSSYTKKILSYTIKDEVSKDIITEGGDIDINVIISSILDSSVNWNYSNATVNVSSIEVCIPNNILNYSDYKMDTIARYEAPDHVVEYHYIENFNLTNLGTTQYISLYDLNESDSTSFLINYKDEYYISVEGAIVDIHRFYVGDGIYRSVEMGKTNDAGQTRAHLVTENVKYRFYVRVSGELVYASPEYLALCQTAPCQIDLYEVTDTSSEYEEAGNIDYTFDLDKSARSITFAFITKDGSTSTVDMNVTKLDAYLNHTACEETQTSSGGSLTCTVPTAYTDTTYMIEVYEDGEYITQRFFNLNPPAVDYFGYTGVFLAFVIIMTLVFMAITSGIAMIVFTILGLIIVGLLNIMDVGNIIGVGSAVIWLSVAGVIIIYKIAQRRYH